MGEPSTERTAERTAEQPVSDPLADRLRDRTRRREPVDYGEDESPWQICVFASAICTKLSLMLFCIGPGVVLVGPIFSTLSLVAAVSGWAIYLRDTPPDEATPWWRTKPALATAVSGLAFAAWITIACTLLLSRGGGGET